MTLISILILIILIMFVLYRIVAKCDVYWFIFLFLLPEFC